MHVDNLWLSQPSIDKDLSESPGHSHYSQASGPKLANLNRLAQEQTIFAALRMMSFVHFDMDN